MREAQPDDRIRTSRQPHRRKVADGDRLDERAESVLGRLNLLGVIPHAELIAGERYAVVVGAYRAVIEAPKGMGGSGRGSNCLAEWGSSACRAEPELCTCLARKLRYDRAFEAVMDAGRRAAMAVGRAAVHGQEPQREDIVYLRIGLKALARFFGVIGR